MNRRALILAGLAALPAAAVLSPASAKPRRTARRQRGAGAKPAGGRKSRAARQSTGGLTASNARTRIVTRTFTSNVPLTIPSGAPGTTQGPATPYPSTLQVSGFAQGRILNVQATLLGLSHTDPDDLDIMLVSPGTVGVILLSDAGTSTAVTGITLTFDQNASSRPPDDLVSGTFQPANLGSNLPDTFPAPAPAGVTGHSLARFNNTNPNGPWSLYVVDDSTTNTGSLGGWSLTIRAKVRVPHRHRRRASQRSARRAKT